MDGMGRLECGNGSFRSPFIPLLLAPPLKKCSSLTYLTNHLQSSFSSTSRVANNTVLCFVCTTCSTYVSDLRRLRLRLLDAIIKASLSRTGACYCSLRHPRVPALHAKKANTRPCLIHATSLPTDKPRRTRLRPSKHGGALPGAAARARACAASTAASRRHPRRHPRWHPPSADIASLVPSLAKLEPKHVSNPA